jgi:hypothetical protein
MRSYQKALEKGKDESLPRTPNKKPKREKLIRITDATYGELMELGKMGDDFEDVIARLLKEHKERQK